MAAHELRRRKTAEQRCGKIGRRRAEQGGSGIPRFGETGCASYNEICIWEVDENRKNTVVSVTYKLSDAQGNLIEESDEPMVYLHGGYDGTFPKIEEQLDGHEPGYEAQVQLEPQDAFGDYDPELVKIEPRDRFPEPLEVGMQFEGTPEDGDEEVDSLIYTVTDVAEDKVVLDGNHPLAGMALRFALTVKDVREATEDEIEHEHAHGAEGLEIVDEDDDEDGEAPSGRTLH